MRLRLMTAALLAFPACRSSTDVPRASAHPDPVESSHEQATLEKPVAQGYQHFGAPISDAPAMVLASVLKEPDRYREQVVLLQGEVRRACTRRGCWMELSESLDPSAGGCRVTFKDYGFFIPTDSVGAHARVQGTVAVATLPAEYVSHLESEGAHFARKNADGTAPEVRLVATGVELRK